MYVFLHGARHVETGARLKCFQKQNEMKRSKKPGLDRTSVEYLQNKKRSF